MSARHEPDARQNSYDQRPHGKAGTLRSSETNDDASTYANDTRALIIFGFDIESYSKRCLIGTSIDRNWGQQQSLKRRKDVSSRNQVHRSGGLDAEKSSCQRRRERKHRLQRLRDPTTSSQSNSGESIGLTTKPGAFRIARLGVEYRTSVPCPSVAEATAKAKNSDSFARTEDPE